MLERLKDELFGKPKDEELEKLASYLTLPNSLKRKVASAHIRLKDGVASSFNETKINKDFTNEQLLSEITHADEFIDKSILKVTQHTLSIDDEEIEVM